MYYLAAVLLAAVALLLSPSPATSQRGGPPRTDYTALMALNFSVAEHVIKVRIANTTLAAWTGPQEQTSPMTTPQSSTGSPGTQGPEPVFDTNAIFLASTVSTYCRENISRCGIVDSEPLTRNISLSENVVYLFENVTENAADNSLTFNAYFRIPNPNVVFSSTPPSPFLPARVIVAAISDQLRQLCLGLINSSLITVSYIQYQTIPGPVISSSAICSNGTTTSSTSATMSTSLSSGNTTTRSNQVSSTPEGNSVNSSTPRSVQVSTAAITTTATVTTSASPRGPVDLASFEIVGTTYEVFIRSDMGNFLDAVEGIIQTNCSISNTSLEITAGSSGDGGNDTVGPVRFDIRDIGNITRAAGIGVSFTLSYTEAPNAADVLDCSGFGMGNSLSDQLKDIFSDDVVIENLGKSIRNGSLAVVSIQATTAPPPGDSGLSTGAIVGIAVGCAAGAIFVAVLAVVIIKYGSGQATVKRTMSSAKIMPSSQGDAELHGPEGSKQAWGNQGSKNVMVEEYHA